MRNRESHNFMLSTLPKSTGGVLIMTEYELVEKFERTCSIDDLNRAIAIMEHSIRMTSANDLNHNIYLNKLGIALARRLLRTPTSFYMNLLTNVITTQVEGVKARYSTSE